MPELISPATDCFILKSTPFSTGRLLYLPLTTERLLYLLHHLLLSASLDLTIFLAVCVRVAGLLLLLLLLLLVLVPADVGGRSRRRCGTAHCAASSQRLGCVALGAKQREQPARGTVGKTRPRRLRGVQIKQREREKDREKKKKKRKEEQA